MPQTVTHARTVEFPAQLSVKTPGRRWWLLREESALGFDLGTTQLRTFVTFDPWKARDDFLSIKGDDRVKQLVDFLNETGTFFGIYESRTTERYWSLQKIFREMLVGSSSDFSRLSRQLRNVVMDIAPGGFGALNAVFTIEVVSGVPHATTMFASTLHGLVASIYVDRVRGKKFGVCARPDCRTPFEIETQHQRKYCTKYCAHIEQVRRSRRKET
jgi:hypothetical protein